MTVAKMTRAQKLTKECKKLQAELEEVASVKGTFDTMDYTGNIEFFIDGSFILKDYFPFDNYGGSNYTLTFNGREIKIDYDCDFYVEGGQYCIRKQTLEVIDGTPKMIASSTNKRTEPFTEDEMMKDPRFMVKEITAFEPRKQVENVILHGLFSGAAPTATAIPNDVLDIIKDYTGNSKR